MPDEEQIFLFPKRSKLPSARERIGLTRSEHSDQLEAEQWNSIFDEWSEQVREQVRERERQRFQQEWQEAREQWEANERKGEGERKSTITQRELRKLQELWERSEQELRERKQQELRERKQQGKDTRQNQKRPQRQHLPKPILKQSPSHHPATQGRVSSVFSFFSIIAPKAIYEEEVGDAEEVINRMIEIGKPEFRIWFKVVSTIFWVFINGLRHITSAVLGKDKPKRRGLEPPDKTTR